MKPLFLSAMFAGCALMAVAQAPPVPAPATPPPVASPDEKARVLFNAGRLDEALGELQAGYKSNPKLSPPRVMLSKMFYDAKNGANARQALEAAAVEDPKHPEVYLLNASYAFSEGRVTDALLSCQTALDLAADTRWDGDQRKRYIRDARLGLASSYEARQNFAAARDQLNEVLADDPQSGPARVRLASNLFRLGQTDEAFAAFQAAHTTDPALDAPELQMANLYNVQGNLDKAEEWLKKAIATQTAKAKPLRTYAGWLLDQGRFADAKPLIDQATQLDTTGKDVLSLKGLYGRYTNNLPEAEAAFEALHKDSPANPFATWNLALVLAETGDKEKLRRATELAEAETRRNPRAAEGFVVLGWCLYKAGQLDEAERTLAQATSLGGVSRDGAYFFARVLTDRMRYADAARALQSALDARGGFVYRPQAEALLAEVKAKVPADPKP